MKDIQMQSVGRSKYRTFCDSFFACHRVSGCVSLRVAWCIFFIIYSQVGAIYYYSVVLAFLCMRMSRIILVVLCVPVWLKISYSLLHWFSLVQAKYIVYIAGANNFFIKNY